jgi:hypothetical protein
MLFKRRAYRSIVSLVVVLGVVIAASGISVLAQRKDPLVDDRPVTITRKPKTNRKRPVRRPVVVQAHLLKIEWKLLKVNSDGSQGETNPLSTFYTGDHLRLVVKANQNGYLYIIHQDNPTAPGQIIFPDSRLNNGRNDVSKLQEITLPSSCPADITPFDCAVIVRPPAGAELFTLVFTRDPIINLPDNATDASGGIPAAALVKLKQDSGQTLVRGKGGSPYSVLVTNTNLKDNEDLFETLVLKKGM